MFQNNFDLRSSTSVMKQSSYRVIILLLLLTSTICTIFSLAGNHWIQTPYVTQGLWKECLIGGECRDLQQTLKVVIYIVRFSLVAGLAFLLMSSCYFIAMVAQPKAFKSISLSILLGIAALAIMVGVSVYTYFNGDAFSSSLQYHWSYWICWVGFVLTAVSTGMTCFDARRPSTPYEHAIRLE